MMEKKLEKIVNNSKAPLEGRGNRRVSKEELQQIQTGRAQIRLKFNKISALRNILQDESGAKILPGNTLKRLETLLFVYDRLIQHREQLADVQLDVQPMSDDGLERLYISVIETLASIDGKSMDVLFEKLHREADEYHDRFPDISAFTAEMEVLNIEIDRKLESTGNDLAVIYGEIFKNDGRKN